MGDRRKDDPKARWNKPIKARAKGRKDTRHWCRGKKGIDHVAQIVLDDWDLWVKKPYCKWYPKRKWTDIDGVNVWEPTGEWAYRCLHVEQCKNCGKKLRHRLPQEECPEFAERKE